MSRVLRCIGLFACLLGIATVVGCGDSKSPGSAEAKDGHDHDHDHDGEHGHGSHAHGSAAKSPATYAEAVEEIAQLCEKLREASATGDVGEMDGPVHAVRPLLTRLPRLAVKASLDEADRKKVDSAIDVLKASFGELDARIHGGAEAGKSFDDVAADIDAAMADLKAISEAGSSS